MEGDLDVIRQYHQLTKHGPQQFAPGPPYLDWANQPDPFRRFVGAQQLTLQRFPLAVEAAPAVSPAAGLDAVSLSQFFYDALALAAWKEYQGARWALRVNPSSGNLHPTESYLITGPVAGLCETPIVAHYAPLPHALAVRARLSPRTWQDLHEGVTRQRGDGLPADAFFVGLTSIHWREAWKYGERAYRYCQHDIGHALAALRISAQRLGWCVRLLDRLGGGQGAALFGVGGAEDPQAEHFAGLIAVYRASWPFRRWQIPESVVEIFSRLDWQGQSNRLSPRHVDWPGLAAAAQASQKPPAPWWQDAAEDAPPDEVPPAAAAGPIPRAIIRQRRSAVAMDGATALAVEAFYGLLAQTLPRPGAAPFDLLPWPPHVSLALFVHRVTGLEAGLYLLARDARHVAPLRAALRPDFRWEMPQGCPPDLALYRLTAGDMRKEAQRLSCGQEIAADGCFSVAMLAEFAGPLAADGAWRYPRLFWECGMIGQMLYLAAELAGVRGTGIGCFFDDSVHQLLGLRDQQFQSLYHFTVGGPVDDPRLTTLPPYASA